MATTGGTKIVRDGLVFNIDAANIKSYPGSGTTWTDVTNNGYNGTLLNGPVFDSGDVGNLDFDGLNDYITIAGNTTNNNHAWTADNSIGSDILCYEIWVKTPDNSGRIISKPWNGNGRYNISVEDGGFYLLVGNGGTPDDLDSSSIISYSSTIDDDIWHQVVVWANSTNQGFYIDGGLDSGSKAHGLTGGISNRGNTTQPLIMMSLYNYGEGWAGNTSYSVEGKVAIFRKYNRVLTASEVLQNYNATKTRFEY
jgi:hypothetical protein